MPLRLPVQISLISFIPESVPYSCEAINPENVGHFLDGNKEFSGHIIINAQIFTIRPLEQNIRKDRELA